MSELVVEEEVEEQASDALPELPEGWSVKKLKDLGTWSGGGTPSKKNESFWRNGTIPWVSPKDMKVPVLLGTQDRITDQAVQGSAAKKKPANSIAVVTRSGILEHSLPVALVPFEATFNQDMKVIAPIPEVDSAWLLWVLTGGSQTILDQCRKDGTTVASIDFEKLQEFALLVPPLENQRAIAAEVEARLGEISALETELDVAEKLQTQFRQALLRDAFTGRLTRGDDLPDTAEADEKGHPVLPTGWEWKTLGEVADTSSGGTPSAKNQDFYGGSIPWLRITDLNDSFIDSSERSITEAGLKASSAKWIEPGAVLVAMYGSIGKLGRLRVRATTNQAICALQPKEAVSSDYLYWFLRHERPKFWTKARGGTQLNISQGDLKTWPIPVPATAEQEQVTTIVETRLGEAENIAAEIQLVRDQLEAFRASLLHQAFTGQLVA